MHSKSGRSSDLSEEREKLELHPEKISLEYPDSEDLNELLEIIRRGPEFPVFSRNVMELMNLRDDSHYPLQEVARIILRDLSLTTKILKVARSVFYQSYHRQVHTVTSAVSFLGFDRIRDLSLGLEYFEKLQQTPALSHFKRLVITSYLTAIYSQELAGERSQSRREEIFLNGLLYNIGELITIFYFPLKYREIQELAASEEISPHKAALKVLKVPWDFLGLATARIWNFPANLINQLTDLHQKQSGEIGSKARLQKLITTSQELSQALLTSSCSEEKWLKKGERLSRGLGLDRDLVSHALKAGLDRFRELVKVLHLDLTPLNLLLPPVPHESPAEADVLAAGPGPGEMDSTEEETAVKQQGGEEGPHYRKLQICHQVIGEINQALVSRTAINEIIVMILEGIYRGLGFDHVILCLVNPARTMVQGRFGLGEQVVELLPYLQTPLMPPSSFLAQALAENRDCLFDLNAQKTDRALLSENFWEQSKAVMGGVFPIVVDQTPLGAIYLDRVSSTTAITREDCQTLRIFRDLAIIAIRSSSAQL
jgi:HD-like signal output (HDOD) protein